MRVRILAATALIATFGAAFLGTFPTPVRAAAPKVAIIVGPVGAQLTPTYISWANESAAAATAAGATVAKAYSPNATAANVLAAVSGANIVIYYGHGSGFPNPYTSTLDPNSVNGWGLQGPSAKGTHEDSWSNGTLKYYGENWITANARPAPNFVMIYSNACYAPGAGEGWDTKATESVAKSRVGYYSRGPLSMGAGAYFATDLWKGAPNLVTKILTSPNMGFGDIYKSLSGYSSAALRTFAHPNVSGKQVWIQKTDNGHGNLDYWYAFAGDPARTPSGGAATPAPAPAPVDPAPSVVGRSPVPLALRVPLSHVVQAQFSEPVTGVTTTSFVLSDATNKAVHPASVTYDAATGIASLTPTVPLASLRNYRVDLTSAIRDAGGNALPATRWYFSTGTAQVYMPSRSLTFAATTHTGYKFNAAGQVVATLQYTLPSASSAYANQRTTIRGQSGVWFYVTSGSWKGYWVRESGSLYLPGFAAVTEFATRPVSFAVGTYTGYQFSSAGAVTARTRAAVPAPVTASANAKAIINGRAYLYIVDGTFGGFWVRWANGVKLL